LQRSKANISRFDNGTGRIIAVQHLNYHKLTAWAMPQSSLQAPEKTSKGQIQMRSFSIRQRPITTMLTLGIETKNIWRKKN
jgi:hypothetical protein